jgi:putative transposase
MNRAERLTLVDHDDPVLPVTAQCRLLKVARSTVYYQPVPASPDDLAVMRRIDELHLESPFHWLAPDGGGVTGRRLGCEPQARPKADAGHGVGGDLSETQYQPAASGPQGVPLSVAGPDHRPCEPGLVRGHHIYPDGQRVCVSGGGGCGRRLPAHRPASRSDGLVQPAGVGVRLSITMETDFCVDALREAMERHGRPEIFNTDQGVQFTSAAFLDELSSQGVRISMDGRGRFLDNIFIERLWRSLKYEEVYIKAYGSVAEARQGIAGWLGFYNEKRPHQALGYRTPRAVYEGEACEHVDNASASLRDAPAL